MLPKSLYIHVPFCFKICNYCDFCKMQYYKDYADKYLTTLFTQIDEIKNFDLQTIYIGGGTPSCLDYQQLKALLTKLDKYSKNTVEFTIEANPESLDEEKIKLFAKHKVNRLSIGVQTFKQDQLIKLNRLHNNEMIVNAINLAKKHGINNISIDLIYGLPKQTHLDFINDIKYALSLDIQHISLYSLTIENNTIFYNLKQKAKKSDWVANALSNGHKMLRKAGFIHYEVSNFAKGLEYVGKHNLVYWQNLPYYGIGPGSHGYIANHRYYVEKNITNYLNNRVIIKKEIVDDYTDEYNFIILNLRTIFGIKYQIYKNIFKVDFLVKYGSVIKMLRANKLIDVNVDGIAVKPSKFLILNQIILKFIEVLDASKEENYAKS